MDIGQKILLTGFMFLLLGLAAVGARVNDDDISTQYKVVFGSFISGGAVCALIGALITIWF